MINLRTLQPLLCENIILPEINLGLSVDNRSLSSETIFIAIVGERYNPLSHLDQVVLSGCKYIIYEKHIESDQLIQNYREKITFLPVENLISNIAKLGELVAEQFKERGGKIIAISGSNGKTTTKEMLFHLIGECFGYSQVICTQKNNNNHLGVPFTLFQISKNTNYAIVELGSNAPGEIEFLCQMIKANIGVTTNIGDTHLEFFETRENVFHEEGVLAEYCKEIFFINNDDKYLSTLSIDPQKVSFGITGKNYKFSFHKDGVEVNNYRLYNSKITGEHNFQNLALAFSIVHYINPQKSEEYVAAAQSFKPTSNRSEWIKIQNTPTFLDAYNANPSSMRVALKGFVDYIENQGSAAEHACVVLGDMNELGQNSAAMHGDVGEFALALNFSQYIFVGRFRDDYTNRVQANITKFETTQQAKEYLAQHLTEYKYLFIKGSRSLQLERITDIK